jgi:hypothetical protein
MEGPVLTLRELQTSFERSVAGNTPDQLLQLIAGDGFDAEARLSIYRNNVVTRLTDTLSAAFPVVCKLVDRGFFAYAADTFLHQHLPASGCLSDYGGDFPSFLAEFPPAAEPRYLPDVARLEWAIHQVRRVAAFPPIVIAALAEMKGDPSLFRLCLTPAVQFVASPYAIDQIWIAHQRDNPWDELQLGSAGVQLQISSVKRLSIVNLSPSTWEFRARLAEGERLGAAIATAMAVSSDFDTTLALAALFRDELVTGII